MIPDTRNSPQTGRLVASPRLKHAPAATVPAQLASDSELSVSNFAGEELWPQSKLADRVELPLASPSPRLRRDLPMPAPRGVPEFDRRCVVVVDRDNVELAAILSSYLARPGKYLPMFSFPRVRDANGPNADINEDTFIARVIGNESATVLKNCMAHVGGCRTVILAGLNDVQKSYLPFPSSVRVAEVVDVAAIEPALNELGIEIRPATLRCQREDILLGLHVGTLEGKKLCIDATAERLIPSVPAVGGLVVVEALPEHVAPVIGVNYASAVRANVAIVDALAEHEPRDILTHIEQWRENDAQAAYDRIRDAINQRVGKINFRALDYATFFTTGLPYTVIMDNVVPCSYVHLTQWADIFVTNAMVAETNEQPTGAVVFSLDEFHAQGEGKWLVRFLEQHEFFVRALVGDNATTRAFDYNAQHFAYGIFHIASHGGEIDGYEVTLRFTDRNGNEHVVQFDEVVAFARAPGPGDLIQVTSKAIFRALDGLPWNSADRKNLGYPPEVYEDMRRVMFDKESWKTSSRRPIPVVRSSCHVQCSNGMHQGMFRSIAAYSHPFIFNNSCWSWSDIANSFLTSGAKAYVGTLWAIDNTVATVGARSFYEAAVDRHETIIDAVHEALTAIDASGDRGIYMLWGLHFSTIPAPTSLDESGSSVVAAMIDELQMQIDYLPRASGDDARQNASEAIKAQYLDIVNSFDFPNIAKFKREIMVQLMQLFPGRRGASAAAPTSPPTADDMMQLPPD